MNNMVEYTGVVILEEVDKKTGEVVQSKCFNNLTPHGLQVMNNGGIFGVAMNHLNQTFNEGVTYVLSQVVKNSIMANYSFEINLKAVTLVGYNLEEEPTDKRFPPHLTSTLEVDMSKVHWWGAGNPKAEQGGKEARLVAPRVKNDDGVVRVMTYEVSAVGTTNSISIILGDVEKPFKGGQSATVLTPPVDTTSSGNFELMNAFLKPGIQGLTAENEILFGLETRGALGVKNLDDGSYYLLEADDPRRNMTISSADSTHCVLGGKLYFHNNAMGRIYSRDLSTGVEKNTSSPNYRYNCNLSTDGEFLYVWSGQGYCYKYSPELAMISSSAYPDFTTMTSTAPTGVGSVTNVTFQNGQFYVAFGASNLILTCTDINNIKSSITGYYSSSCLTHIPTYNCFLGGAVPSDFSKLYISSTEGATFNTGGIKKIPDTCGSQFNFIWDVKCSDGSPFTVESADNPVYVTYGFTCSNKA